MSGALFALQHIWIREGGCKGEVRGLAILASLRGRGIAGINSNSLECFSFLSQVTEHASDAQGRGAGPHRVLRNEQGEQGGAGQEQRAEE